MILYGSFCGLQVETIEQYFPVFDKLRKEFLVGEMIWNFADFNTKQGTCSSTAVHVHCSSESPFPESRSVFYDPIWVWNSLRYTGVRFEQF